MAPLKIVIVGAGIGGPAAAIGLARNGHSVTIYERSTSTSEVGYAFRITANSDRCLKYLGIDTVAGGACVANSMRMFSADGSLLVEHKENADAERAKRGTSVFAYRPQLNQQLLDKARESGVVLKSGVKVKSVDTIKTELELDDGMKVSADLIIAADGVHSVVRPSIVDTSKHFPSASTGHNALRFMVSKSTVQNDPIMSTVVKDDTPMFSWKGHDERILVYPVDFDKQYNVTCTHPQQLSDQATSNVNSATAVAYNKKIALSTVRSIYSDFHPTARRLFELADPKGFRVWKLLDMDDFPTWSSHHTTLLGDACHPLSPFGFSGASMAIEDALTLSTLFGEDVGTGEIRERLKLYEEIRKPRVGRVRETAREIARGGESKQLMEEYMGWLSAHDAVEYANDVLAKHLDKEIGFNTSSQ